MSNKKSIYDLSDVDPTNERTKHLEKRNKKRNKRCSHPFREIKISDESGVVCTLCGEVLKTPEEYRIYKQYVHDEVIEQMRSDLNKTT